MQVAWRGYGLIFVETSGELTQAWKNVYKKSQIFLWCRNSSGTLRSINSDSTYYDMLWNQKDIFENYDVNILHSIVFEK